MTSNANTKRTPAEAHSDALRDRAPRFESHTLVDVRLSSWNPFSKASAVLLDLSVQGFKIEFLGPVAVRPGDALTMILPLLPFGVQSPRRLKLRIQFKWIDRRTFRAGGVFTHLGQDDAAVLKRILSSLAGP